MEFRHDNGELFLVHIDLDGTGVRRIRLAGLAPEVKDKTIREALSPYGEVKEVHEDTWSKGYCYHIYNGVRTAVTNLKKHLPSHMKIAGTRVLISYEGQPPTCYGCNEQGHLNQDCPHRRQAGAQREDTHKTSWANIVTLRSMRQQNATTREAVPSQQIKHDRRTEHITTQARGPFRIGEQCR